MGLVVTRHEGVHVCELFFSSKVIPYELSLTHLNLLTVQLTLGLWIFDLYS